MATYKKELPHDTVTERTVIGLMIAKDEVATKFLGELNVDDFYVKNVDHRTIFSAMQRIKSRGKPVSYSAVVNELIAMNKLEDVGGSQVVFDIAEEAIETSDLNYYTSLLKDTTYLRNFIKTIRELNDDFEGKDIGEINEYLSNADTKITEITRNRSVSGFKKASDLAKSVSQELMNRVGGDSSTLAGVSTGYSSLDKITSGFKKGELIYMAARPAVGKTTLALSIAYNVARTGRPVLVYEYEMTSEELFKKILASRSNVPMNKMDTGYLSKEDKIAINEKSNEIAKVPLYFDDESGVTIDDIAAHSRRLKNELKDLGLIMIDYIGLIPDRKYGNKNESRRDVISSYSHLLKQLALELEVPILCLCQLSRKTEERDDKRPVISDLRDSGDLEQDADKVILLYRPGYYEDMGISLNKNKKKDDGNLTINDQRSITKTAGGADYVEVNVAKNRSGQPNKTTLLFFKEFGQFSVADEQTQALVNEISSNG